MYHYFHSKSCFLRDALALLDKLFVGMFLRETKKGCIVDRKQENNNKSYFRNIIFGTSRGLRE